MNRRIIVFMLAMAVLLLPQFSSAQNKPKIKSVDLVIPVPTPGMTREKAQTFQLTSAKTEYGDLAATGDITIQSLDWTGDFEDTDDGDQFFKSGFSYRVSLQFMVKTDGKYTTDYVFKNNVYYIDGTRIKATVNGISAKVLNSAPYFINIEVVLKVGTDGTGSDKAAAQQIKTDYELNKNSYRGSQKAYSTKEADLACPETNPYDVIAATDSYRPQFNPRSKDFPGQKSMLIKKIIVDTENGYYDDLKHSYAEEIPSNIREVWISNKVDAASFVRMLCQRQDGDDSGDRTLYKAFSSNYMNSNRATLFIPETSAAKVLELFKKPFWSYHLLYQIKTYSGDVYSAQKAGAEAAKPFPCTSHVFTDKVIQADKVCSYVSCKHRSTYYYSCRICGKCERNSNHTFSEYGNKEAEFLPHNCSLPLANDQAYVGVNAAGHHVWWHSCIWCGQSDGYGRKHTTKAEWRGSGNQANYEYFKKVMAEQTETYESDALRQSTAPVGMFILPYKSNAKTSVAFQSAVNYALNDNLLDDKILGNDYTVPVTRLQLKSLAVRLAEELIGHEIKADKSSYSDDYTPKAVAMGLLDEHFSSFKDAATDKTPATRQEVAAMIYGTLRYIEKQGVYAYTEYDSKLTRYTDNGKIASWAQEAMAFMDALGLMTGTTSTLMSPEAVCTIEKAIEVAQKSTHAQQLGWYQARSFGEGIGRTFEGHMFFIPSVSANTSHTFSNGERVWVTGPRIGETYGCLPIVDPYKGETLYVKAEWFRPVRKQVFTSERTTFEPLQTREYFNGVSMISKMPETVKSLEKTVQTLEQANEQTNGQTNEQTKKQTKKNTDGISKFLGKLSKLKLK